MSERSYGNSTLAGLAVFSRGTCYFPGCPVPIAIKEHGRPVMMAQIAHIKALKQKGARHDNELSPGQANDWPNLIYLCQAHHTLVDRIAPLEYPEETLYKWKDDHEQFGVEGLRGLTGLTEDRLQAMLEHSSEQIKESLVRTFAQLDPDDRELLQELTSGMLEVGTSVRRLDVDAISSLGRSARRLANFGDHTSQFSKAVDKLGDLESQIAQLERATRRLPDY